MVACTIWRPCPFWFTLRFTSANRNAVHRLHALELRELNDNAANAMNFAQMLSVLFIGGWMRARQMDGHFRHTALAQCLPGSLVKLNSTLIISSALPFGRLLQDHRCRRQCTYSEASGQRLARKMMLNCEACSTITLTGVEWQFPCSLTHWQFPGALTMPSFAPRKN